jgi:hypothetical protein
VVIDRAVDVVEPGPWRGPGRAVLVAVTAVDPPAATLPQPGRLLHVHMDQFAGAPDDGSGSGAPSRRAYPIPAMRAGQTRVAFVTVAAHPLCTVVLSGVSGSGVVTHA